jgi:triphosphatase
MEIELKLALQDAANAGMEAGAAEAAIAAVLGEQAQRFRAQRLVSYYFDAPDRRLQRAGFSLRVRKVGKRFIQTLKGPSAGEAGLMAREEWEHPTEGPVPDLLALLHGPGLPIPGLPCLDAPLAPLALIFTTEMRRARWRLRPQSGLCVEVCLDRGQIFTPYGDNLPVHEVEFELVEGDDRAVLIDLALAVADKTQASLGLVSKSMRGYALAQGKDADWALRQAIAEAIESLKTTGVLSDPEAAPAAVLSAWLWRETMPLIRRLDATMAGDLAVRPVHATRTAARRLRSLLSLCKDFPLADAADMAAMTALLPPLKELAKTMEGMREWDVAIAGSIASLEGLFDHATAATPVEEAAFPWRASLSALRSAAMLERSRQRAQAAGHLARTRSALMRIPLALAALAQRIRKPAIDAGVDAGGGIARLGAALLERLWRKARRQGRNFARLTPDERHELRLRLKKLAFAAELLAPFYGGTRPFRRALAAAVAGLGQGQDAAVIARRLPALMDHSEGETSLALVAAIGAAVGRERVMAATLERRLRKRWRDLKQARPFWQIKDG